MVCDAAAAELSRSTSHAVLWCARSGGAVLLVLEDEQVLQRVEEVHA